MNVQPQSIATSKSTSAKLQSAWPATFSGTNPDGWADATPKQECECELDASCVRLLSQWKRLNRGMQKLYVGSEGENRLTSQTQLPIAMVRVQMHRDGCVADDEALGLLASMREQ